MNRVRATEAAFLRLARRRFPGKRVHSAAVGICATDAAAVALGLKVIEVNTRIRLYVHTHRAEKPRHISAADWTKLETEAITIWKVDVDFFWVAAATFGVTICVCP